MADKEFSRLCGGGATTSTAAASVAAKDDALPLMRRVNYYFAKPKEQTPTTTRIAIEEQQHYGQQHQHQLKSLAMPNKNAAALINSNKAQIYEHATELLEHGEPSFAASTSAARAETQAEAFRAKKLIPAFDKDLLHHSRLQCASEIEKYAGMKALNAVPRGIFGKKTKAQEIIADYDYKSPIACVSDALLCSEPLAWQCKPPFPKEITAKNLQKSIFSADFLQCDVAVDAAESKEENWTQLVDDEINDTCDLNVSDDYYLINCKHFDMNPIPDIPGSENLL